MVDVGGRLAVIVEDDPDVRNLLRTILTQSGFEAIVTSNGEDGVEAVRRYSPVLTTLDVSMPGMDGVAAAARIREFSNTYILMITAQSEEIDIIQGLDAGADEYLVKPFRARELRARIESLLRRPREVRGVPSAPAQSTDPSPHGTVWRRDLPQAPAGEPYVPQSQMTNASAPLEAPVAQPPVTQPPVPERPAPERPAPERPAPERPAPAPAQQASAPGPVVTPAEGANPAFHHHGLVLDPVQRMVSVDGVAIAVEQDEFDLLHTLMSSGRRVRSKADLVLTARGESYVTTYYVREGDKRDIDVVVAQLRRRLGDTEPSRWIETVRGVGYRMTI